MIMKSTDTDYLYGLLMEGKMDLMFLPAGAVAWLWQYDRPDTQIDAAIRAASASQRAGNPIMDANLLRADQNILVLHLRSSDTINVYPDGGYGSKGAVIDDLEGYIQGSVYDSDPDVGGMSEPVVDLPDDLDLDIVPPVGAF